MGNKARQQKRRNNRILREIKEDLVARGIEPTELNIKLAWSMRPTKKGMTPPGYDGRAGL